MEDRLAILSGLARVRLVPPAVPARELRDLLPNIRTEIWGSHGGKELRHDGSYELFKLEPVQQAALEEVRRELSALGFAERYEIKLLRGRHWRSLDAGAGAASLLCQSVFGPPSRTGRATPATLR